MLKADYYADCGNSCSKILDPNMHTVQRLEDEQLTQWVADHAMPGSHLIILPGNRERAEHLRTIASAQQAVVTKLSDGVSIPDCGQYQSMGLDRLCSGLAAMQKMQRDLIVIDAGTMLTLGAWRHDKRSDFNCCFAGGFIAPGPQACLDAMHHAAPALPALQLNDSNAAYGTDTESHMQAAINHGWPALCMALLEQLRQLMPDAALVLCGGFHQRLPLQPDHHDPALVLHGMQVLCEAATV